MKTTELCGVTWRGRSAPGGVGAVTGEAELLVAVRQAGLQLPRRGVAPLDAGRRGLGPGLRLPQLVLRLPQLAVQRLDLRRRDQMMAYYRSGFAINHVIISWHVIAMSYSYAEKMPNCPRTVVNRKLSPHTWK